MLCTATKSAPGRSHHLPRRVGAGHLRHADNRHVFPGLCRSVPRPTPSRQHHIVGNPPARRARLSAASDTTQVSAAVPPYAVSPTRPRSTLTLMLPAQSGLTRDNGRVSASFNGRMSDCHSSLPQPKKTPNLARLSLESRAAAPADADAEMRHQQEEAARSRLVEELGRMLIRLSERQILPPRFPGDADIDAATPRSGSPQRLSRLASPLHIELRQFRELLSGSRVKTRLTGRELDAALDDPRRQFGPPAWSARENFCPHCKSQRVGPADVCLLSR